MVIAASYHTYIWLKDVFISSFGLTRNEYSGSLVQATITMDAFFDSKL